MPSRSNAAPVTLQNPSDQTTHAASPDELVALPARAAQFLFGVVATPSLRATLALAGLTTEQIAEGRRLLVACIAEPAPSAPFGKVAIEKRRAALAELNAWDEPGFARFGAALKLHAPDAHAYVFGGVVASSVAQRATLAIATFLGRVAVLEAGTTRPADPAAIALLEARGLTREVREHLVSLVGTALGPGSDDDIDAPIDLGRLERLRALGAWYAEWAETARALLTKRDAMTRLGLGQRKARSRRARRSAAEPIPDTERAPQRPSVVAGGPRAL